MAIFVKHNKVSSVPDDADTSLVRPSDWNADHTLTGFGTAAEKDAGVANGVASLDGTGKVPVSELPSAVLGALNYQGTWNASTNTPTLTSSVGTKGYYYVVNVAGTTNLNGITDWQVGDWAVYNGTVWEKVDNTDAGGDVVGPTSATDNAIARYDGTTGRVIQNSVVTVSDTGGIAGATTITDINYVDFNTAYSTTLGVGQLGWDGNDTLGIGMSGGNIVQEIGLQTFIYGKATSAITKGQLIKKTGSNGSSGVITFAPTTANMTNSADVIGIAAETIALNGFGYVMSTGNLRGFNTTGSSSGETWADGDTLYYNPSGNGLMTKTKPSAPNMKTEVAIVINAGSGGSGSVAVEIIHGTQLGGTDSNVQITSPTGGQLLSYDQTNQYWKNTSLTAGTGITVSPATGGTITVTNDGVTQATAGTGISVSAGTGNVTITNTAPDQTVSITAGTGISVSGTYPSFTVANTGVTSVTGTSPVVSSGGATPAISMPAATASVNGYLTSADWTTFNSKQPAGTYVTSVSGTTGRITSSGGTTPAIDLASGIVTAGTTGSSTLIPVITVDTYGRVTSVTTASNPQGTVTSVTGTAPIVSSGGATPAISIPQATSSVNGFLSSTDWTTFNNKGSGTVTSVAALTLGTTGSDLSSTVANGTTTPVITLNVPTASATNRGALSSADWTTFNSKAAPFTYTLTYIPFGQGTTTPNQSANLTFDGTTQSAPVQRASNGIVTNNKTIGTSFTIPSTDNAMSSGPVTLSSGVTVTVSSGSRWVVL